MREATGALRQFTQGLIEQGLQLPDNFPTTRQPFKMQLEATHFLHLPSAGQIATLQSFEGSDSVNNVVLQVIRFQDG